MPIDLREIEYKCVPMANVIKRNRRVFPSAYKNAAYSVSWHQENVVRSWAFAGHSTNGSGNTGRSALAGTRCNEATASH